MFTIKELLTKYFKGLSEADIRMKELQIKCDIDKFERIIESTDLETALLNDFDVKGRYGSATTIYNHVIPRLIAYKLLLARGSKEKIMTELEDLFQNEKNYIPYHDNRDLYCYETLDDSTPPTSEDIEGISQESMSDDDGESVHTSDREFVDDDNSLQSQ